MNGWQIISVGFIVVILIILASCIKIVPQAQAYVLERLGGYQGTWNVGVHFKVPFIDRVARKIARNQCSITCSILNSLMTIFGFFVGIIN